MSMLMHFFYKNFINASEKSLHKMKLVKCYCLNSKIHNFLVIMKKNQIMRIVVNIIHFIVNKENSSVT